MKTGLSTKTLAMLLVGVIIGSAAGYSISTLLTGSIIEDFQLQIDDLEEKHIQLEADFDEVRSEKEDLEQQLLIIQREHSDLLDEKENLLQEQQALEEQMKTLEDLYESLLDDYQKSVGGLDFSNLTLPVIERSFAWSYKGNSYSVSINVPEPMYDYYSNKDRYQTSDYRGYILHPYDDYYIKTLIWEFRKIGALNGLDSEEQIGLIISFVQNLPYLTDDSENFDEYPKFPVETLIDGGGDCEDTSILLSHLLEVMGHDTALLTLPNHMAVGLALNASGAHWVVEDVLYYYIETTATGWKVGDLPSEHAGKSATINVVDNIPFLMHTWEAVRKNNVIDVTITYTNESPYAGSGYRAWVGVELLDGRVYSEKVGSELKLEFGESKVEKIVIEGERNNTMRLIVGVLTPDGYVITQKYSEYFETR